MSLYGIRHHLQKGLDNVISLTKKVACNESQLSRFFKLNISINGIGIIDWGDGLYTNITASKNYNHTYSDEDKTYTVYIHGNICDFEIIDEENIYNFDTGKTDDEGNKITVSGTNYYTYVENISFFNCNTIKNIILTSCGVKNIDVRHCYSLEKLLINNISNNTKSANTISVLDLSDCVNLKVCNVSGNNITDLNLQNNLLLEELYISNLDNKATYTNGEWTITENNLGTIETATFIGCKSLENINNLPKSLKILNINGFAGTAIDLSNCEKLEKLCFGTGLEGINLSNCTALKVLFASPEFETLDLSSCTNLQFIQFGNKNYSGNTYIYSGGRTQLTSLDISCNRNIIRFFGSLPKCKTIITSNSSQNNAFKTIHFDLRDSQIQTLDLTNFLELEKLYLYSNANLYNGENYIDSVSDTSDRTVENMLLLDYCTNLNYLYIYNSTGLKLVDLSNCLTDTNSRQFKKLYGIHLDRTKVFNLVLGEHTEDGECLSFCPELQNLNVTNQQGYDPNGGTNYILTVVTHCNECKQTFCQKLTNINLSSTYLIDTSSANLRYNTNLTTVRITNCKKLESFDLCLYTTGTENEKANERVKLDSVYIFNCSSLKYLDISNLNKLKTFNSYSCTSLNTLYYDFINETYDDTICFNFNLHKNITVLQISNNPLLSGGIIPIDNTKKNMQILDCYNCVSITGDVDIVNDFGYVSTNNCYMIITTNGKITAAVNYNTNYTYNHFGDGRTTGKFPNFFILFSSTNQYDIDMSDSYDYNARTFYDFYKRYADRLQMDIAEHIITYDYPQLCTVYYYDTSGNQSKFRNFVPGEVNNDPNIYETIKTILFDFRLVNSFTSDNYFPTYGILNRPKMIKGYNNKITTTNKGFPYSSTYAKLSNNTEQLKQGIEYCKLVLTYNQVTSMDESSELFIIKDYTYQNQYDLNKQRICISNDLINGLSFSASEDVDTISDKITYNYPSLIYTNSLNTNINLDGSFTIEYIIRFFNTAYTYRNDQYFSYLIYEKSLGNKLTYTLEFGDETDLNNWGYEDNGDSIIIKSIEV